jgi:hypothetical protein
MRVLVWILGIVMVLAVVYFGLQIVASESGEVVVLHSLDGTDEVSTRLWIAEDGAGQLWLRAGEGSGWFGRLQSEPRIELTRDGHRQAFLAVADANERAHVNALMAHKYRWRDSVIAVLVGGREDAIAVRLTPLPD